LPKRRAWDDCFFVILARKTSGKAKPYLACGLPDKTTKAIQVPKARIFLPGMRPIKKSAGEIPPHPQAA
jgi:hypothetical protein